MVQVNLLPVQRTCSKCGGDGPFSPGLTVCRCCRNKAAKAWRQANLEKSRGYSRKYHGANNDRCRQAFSKWYRESATSPRQRERRKTRNLRLYGLTKEAFDELFVGQQGRCTLCGGVLEERGRGKLGACVDHDHTTGKVRGLLHRRCNSGIGLFDDDPAQLKKAVEYLERCR